MILDKPGETFEYEGRKLMIGDQIIANGKSAYEGLFGAITEIRDGIDKETENKTPDPLLPFRRTGHAVRNRYARNKVYRLVRHAENDRRYRFGSCDHVAGDGDDSQGNTKAGKFPSLFL